MTAAASTGRPERLVTGVAAAALLLAAAWDALIITHITVAAPPPQVPGEPAATAAHRYYTWFAGTVVQERLAITLAIVGLAGVGYAAVAVAGRLRAQGAPRPAAGPAAGAALAGALLWTVGNIIQIGAHRAVGLMATHGNPIETVNAINFTADLVDSAFELAAAALLGAGLLGLARAARGRGAAWRSWRRVTIALGVVLLGLAAVYAVDNGDATTWLSVAVGAVGLPAWLLSCGRLRDAVPAHATGAAAGTPGATATVPEAARG